MANVLKTASSWLEDQRHEYTTETVRYERGVDGVDLSATIGRTLFEVDSGYGVIERIESRDFLVLTSDLMLEGVAALPQRGDRIRETQGATIYVYEVMAPGKEPHYRCSDPYRKTLRIHTKHVATEAAP